MTTTVVHIVRGVGENGADEDYKNLLERAKAEGAKILGRGVKYMRVRRVHKNQNSNEYRIRVSIVGS